MEITTFSYVTTIKTDGTIKITRDSEKVSTKIHAPIGCKIINKFATDADNSVIIVLSRRKPYENRATWLVHTWSESEGLTNGAYYHSRPEAINDYRVRIWA